MAQPFGLYLIWRSTTFSEELMINILLKENISL